MLSALPVGAGLSSTKYNSLQDSLVPSLQLFARASSAALWGEGGVGALYLLGCSGCFVGESRTSLPILDLLGETSLPKLLAPILPSFLLLFFLDGPGWGDDGCCGKAPLNLPGDFWGTFFLLFNLGLLCLSGEGGE